MVRKSGQNIVKIINKIRKNRNIALHCICLSMYQPALYRYY